MLPKIRSHITALLRQMSASICHGAVGAYNLKGDLIVILTPNEKRQVFANSPRIYQVELNVEVSFLTSGEDPETILAKLDGAQTRINDLLESDRSLGGLVEDLSLTGCERELSDEAERPLGRLAMRYLIAYKDETCRRKAALPQFAGGYLDDHI